MLSKLYNESQTKKLLCLLFEPKKLETKSSIFGFLKKLYLPYLSEISLGLALLIVWYKSFLGQYIPFLNLSYLPLVLLALALVYANKERTDLNKALFYYLLFLFVALVSGFLAILGGSNGMMVLLGFILFAQFGLAILLSQMLTYRTVFLKFVVFASLPMSLLGLFQFFTHVQTSNLWVSTLETGTTRVFAFLGSPNVLGSMLAIIAFLAFGLFISEKKKLYLLISTLNIFVVGLTLSRSAWLGILVGAVAILILFRAKYLLFTPVALLALLIPTVRKRITVAFTPSYYMDSVIDGRLWAWINGLYILKAHPLLGTGPGTYGGELALNYASPIYLQGIQNGYTALYFTDNQFLEILVQTGIIGVLAFIFYIVAQIWQLIENYTKNHSKIALGALGAFVCFLVSALFANNLEFTAVALPMAIILGAVND